MGVEVRQLVVKGSVVQRASDEPAPGEAAPEPVDEEEILVETRRAWAEEERQRRER